jgi:hypothetical protein
MLDAHQLLWTQIAAGVCSLNFCGLVYNLSRSRRRMQAARSWDKIEGIISASEVERPASHVSDDLDDATPIIRYRYRFGGQDLESDQVQIGGMPLTTRVLAGRRIARYPVGAHVDVYVDPHNPNNALLEPAASDNIVGQIVFTILFGFAAATLTAHSIAGHVLYTGNGVPLFAFALPGIAILAALFSVVAFVRARRLAGASAQWPAIPGTVTNSSVIEEQIEDDSNSDKSTIRKIPRYQLDLRYAYRVGKRDYIGTSATLAWTPIYGLRDQAETEASKYRPGAPVTVYYDPDRPRIAVLEPENKQGSAAPLVFGAISAVAGGAMLAFFLKVGFDQ